MKRKELKGKLSTFSLLALVGYLLLHFAYIYFTEPETTAPQGDLAYVHYIDVGQADSILIQSEGFNMLIDAGEGSKPVIEYLENNDISHLNYVVATHPHSDHIGGMADVVTAYSIDNFIMPDVVHTTATFEKMILALEESSANIISAEPGYDFGTDLISFEVLGPISKDYDNLNNYSVIIKMTAGDTTFFFGGDAEGKVENELLNAGYDLSADVYKVSHHGSNSSSKKAFIEAMNPQLAVISCGKDNTYGHPHKEVINTLDSFGAEILRTDEGGTIVVYTDGTNISYGSER